MFKKPLIFLLSFPLLWSFSCGPSSPGDVVKPPRRPYPEIDRFPSWSPDGKTIAYFHLGVTRVDPRGGFWVDYDSTGIWLINSDGTENRLFFKGGDTPSWSPDGRWLAFSLGAQIYKITVNGDSLTQLTFEGRNFFPKWSPDGERIAYRRSTPEGGVYIMDAWGTYHRRVIEWGGYASWVNESQILFRKGGIWISDTLGQNRVLLLSEDEIGAVEIRSPSLSPDGSKIIFSAWKEGQPLQVWIMNADGSNPKELTTEGGKDPCWSPDGTRIVYVRYNSREFSSSNGRLWIMDSNGANRVQLTP